MTDGGAPTVTGAGAASTHDPLQFSPHQRVGGYQIVRLLGRGGMGEVYEAEHLESGRRLALKVLRRRFHDASDRARFLREGQLAASISHPHTVYVFGSEEIGGTPMISMELLPGGTLKDRVAQQGPLPPQEATVAALDIVSGLDAAHAAGILHRDIKPSNCFVDADGAVKVGDFGLSISTLARDIGQRLTGFEGTPSFAAPEQLRGQALDVRTDVYAVGATLYFLLTGRAPFDAPDLDALVEAATTQTPVSPGALRRGIPEGLSRLVMRCLSRDPAQRPASHAALAEALRPFAAAVPPPAPLGMRFLAWCVDSGILGVMSLVGVALNGRSILESSRIPDAEAMWGLLSVAFSFLYFLLTEGHYGASLGKRLLGLCVRRSDGTRAPWRDVAVRTAIFHGPQWLLTGLMFASLSDQWITILSMVLPALVVVTIRRSNGWAAVHDLATATRVVRRAADVVISGAATAEPVWHEDASAERIGPFAVVAPLGETDDGRLLLGFDPLLRRRVWIHVRDARAAGAPPVRRNVSRHTRLHWLAGRHTDDTSWDAFEAPHGTPFQTAALGDTTWSEARGWLLDVVRELTLAARAGTLPTLGLDRLWLRADRRLVLLDFPAPLQSRAAPPDTSLVVPTPGDLVSALARHLLRLDDRLRPVRLPVSVRTELRAWSASAPTLADAGLTLQKLPPIAGHVRGRRLLLVAAPVVLVLTMILFTWLLLRPSLDLFFATFTTHGEMFGWLELLENPPPESRLQDPAVVRQAERYVAGRFGSRLADEAVWQLPGAQEGPGGRPIVTQPFARLRPRAEALARQAEEVSAAELRSLEATLALERAEIAATAAQMRATVRLIAFSLSMMFVMSLLAFGGAITIVCALIVPGGLMTRAAGLAVITADGREIRRGRSALRALIAVSPVLAGLVCLMVSFRVRAWIGPNVEMAIAAALVPVLLLGAGLVWTVGRPQQGLHDRLVRVWVVSR